MARGLIADPEFVTKREREVCRDSPMRGLQPGCFDKGLQQLLIGCTVNRLRAGVQRTSLGLATQPKRILVAGAGPAGCEFALRAAQRGHKSYSATKKHIGDKVHWAADATSKHELHHLLNYYKSGSAQVWCNLRMGSEVTREQVRRRSRPGRG